MRALYLVYTPERLPADVYKGEMRERLIDIWKRFKAVFQNKMATQGEAMETESVDADEQSDSTDTSGNLSQCIRNFGMKLSQYYEEFSRDNADIIGTLLGRLDMPELPVGGNEEGVEKGEENEKEN
jgi:hypothetical protein